MAGKPKNRLELRRQYEAAEPIDPMEDESEDVADEAEDEDEGERRPKKKVKLAAKAKPKAAKPVKPAARMRVAWTVVNDAFKTIATFEYTQREAAEAKAAEMTARGKGTHFIQRVKEPMPDNAPGLGAAIPRPIPEPETAKAAKVAAKAAEVDDDLEDDEDTDADADSGDDEDEE